MKYIFKWLILSGAVILAAYIIPGISVGVWTTALWVGLVLGCINVFIKPVLKFLTLPINILTLGIFSLVLNALLFWGAAFLVRGFTVDTFIAALLGSLIVSVVTSFSSLFVD